MIQGSGYKLKPQDKYDEDTGITFKDGVFWIFQQNTCVVLSANEIRDILSRYCTDTKAVDEQAEELYKIYPRKQGKKAALPKIKKAIKEAGYETLKEAVQEFREATDGWPKEDRRLIPHPCTWFNQGRWEDDRSFWWEKSTQRRPQESEVGLADLFEEEK